MTQKTQTSSPLKTSAQFVGTLWRMQPRKFVSSVVISVVTGLLGGCGILLLLPLLEILNKTQQTPQHGISRILTTSLERVGVTPTLEAILVLFLMLVGSQVWMRRQLALNNARLRLEFTQALQNRMFKSIACVRWSFFIRQRLSDFIHVLSRDLNRVSHGTLLVLNLLSSAILVTIHLGLSLLVSPWLSAIVIGSTLLLAPFLIKLNQLASRTGTLYASRSRDFLHRIEQQLAGMKEIKSLGAETQQIEMFRELTQAIRDAELDYTKAHTNAAVMFTFGSAVLLCGLLLTAVNGLQIATTELLVLVVIFGRLAPQFRQVHNHYQSLLHTLASFESVIDTQSALEGDEEMLTDPKTSATTGPASADHRHSIQLEDIGFRYDPDSNNWALQNVSLKVPVSQTTALVGPSGSGKSTLADLLLGLLQPTYGRLLIDGTPLDSSNLAAWRNRIGYVPQETFLLHDSVRANLLLAKSDADDAELQSALKAAAAAAFVDQLPERLDTIIGDRGTRISGGERQRLALARALLRQPDILILDEATSSLDTENQNRILAAIEQMHGKLTIIMIAHRLSTVRHADQVVVLEQGKVVESGSYDELAAKASGTFQSYLKADSLTEPT